MLELVCVCVCVCVCVWCLCWYSVGVRVPERLVPHGDIRPCWPWTLSASVKDACKGKRVCMRERVSKIVRVHVRFRVTVRPSVSVHVNVICVCPCMYASG